jgi:BNR repeat-containing family member
MRQPIQRLLMTLSLFISLPACAATSAGIHDVAPGHNPTLAADKNGHLYAAFEAKEPGSAVIDIFVTESSDGAKTWTAPVDVSKTPGNSTDPAIAIDTNGAIDVAWKDTTSGEKSPDIFFARSTDGGKGWSKAVDVSHTAGVSSDPALATGPDNSIHMVWTDTTSGETHPDIYYGVSTDSGKNWSKAKDISNTPGVSSDPTIAVSADGAVHVAWKDTSSGPTNPDIYYTWKSTGSWNKPIDVSNSPRVSNHPSLACSKSKVFLSWTDNSQKEQSPDVWCAVSNRPGNFSKPLNLSNTPGESSQARITADSAGRVAAVWSDTSSGVDHPDIYATVSSDNLKTDSTAMDLTNTLGVSKHPNVALTSDSIVVVWEEIEGSKSTVKAVSKELKGIPAKAPIVVDDSKLGSQSK